MKNLTAFVVFGLLLVAGRSSAQVKIYIDKTFGTGGMTEVNIGGFNNEVTDYDINHDSKITTICGKVSTAIPGMYKLAMIRLDSSGKLDNNFGTGGIFSANWAASDYPTAMDIHSDSGGMYILAGVSNSLGLVDDHSPALYRIQKNGTPDSGFGINGRFALQFQDQSIGDADNIRILDTGYVLCGQVKANLPGGVNGFGVMRVDMNGTLHSDTSTTGKFGFGGRAVIPALVHAVHGFILNNRRIFMLGISDTGKAEILLAFFTENGIPDSSAGVNGLVHTGIIISGGDSFMASMQGDDKVLVLLSAADSSPTPLVICRFDPHSANRVTFLDSSYGDNGFGRNLIPPSIMPKGMNAVSDFSTVVSGEAKVGLGHCIFTRINPFNAKPDPKYYPNGITTIDVDNGEFENYMKFVEPIGKLTADKLFKRDVGIGGSIHSGITYFMIARFITQTPASVAQTQLQENLLRIYPNPAVSELKVYAGNEVKNIRVVDALGREVMRLDHQSYSADSKTFSATVSEIPDGIYYCLAQIGAEQIVRKFIITH